MDGTNIDNLLAACVGDALVSHDPEKDESDPHQRYRMDAHTSSSLPNVSLDELAAPLAQTHRDHQQQYYFLHFDLLIGRFSLLLIFK